MKITVPKFYLISSDPDRENTEDYLRKHFEKSQFYSESKEVNMPVRRIHASLVPATTLKENVSQNEDFFKSHAAPLGDVLPKFSDSERIKLELNGLKDSH